MQDIIPTSLDISDAEKTTAIDAALNQAITLHKLMQFDAADQAYTSVLQLQPHHFIAQYLRGVLANQTNKNELAMQLKQEATSKNPLLASAYYHLGKILCELEQYQEAIICFNRAIELKPHFIEAYCAKGNAFQSLNKAFLAIGIYDHAIAIKPSAKQPYLSKALLFLEAKNFQKAIECFEVLIWLESKHKPEIKPPDSSQSLHERFAHYLETVTTLYPDNHLAKYWLGNSYAHIDRIDDAINCYRDVMQLKPDMTLAKIRLAPFLLQKERFDEGWQMYEWRWNAPDKKRLPLDTNPPEWSPEFNHGPVLVWSEQGLGDQILFSNLINDLQAQVSQIILAVDYRLVNLFSTSFPAIKVISREQSTINQEKFATQIPMASLGQYFRKNAEDFIRWRKPYLKTKNSLADHVQHNLKQPGKLVCGLSWKSVDNPQANDKSIPLEALAETLSIPDFHFIDLQYTDASIERQQLKDNFNLELHKIHEVDNKNDIDSLTALINSCDVIVTISNTTAHLAGALGKKVFLMLPKLHGLIWYWHDNREESLCYPNIRIFRQSRDGDWSDVIKRVKAALINLSETRHG